MKAERSNASTERILALLVLLLDAEQTRAGIYTHIDAYTRASASEQARRKMLDRDLSTLERAGINIVRRAIYQAEQGNQVAGYRAFLTSRSDVSQNGL